MNSIGFWLADSAVGYRREEWLNPWLLQAGHIFKAPVLHYFYYRHDGFPDWGKPVLDPWGHFRVDKPLDDIVFFQLAELVDQHLLADDGERLLQETKAVAFGADRINDHGFPFASDLIQEMGDATFIRVKILCFSPVGHWAIFNHWLRVKTDGDRGAVMTFQVKVAPEVLDESLYQYHSE